VHAPFTGWLTSMAVAVTAVGAVEEAVGGAVGAPVAEVRPVPAALSRTTTHAPSVRLLAVPGTVLVTLVVLVKVTAVWSVAPCTCIVVPCTSAMSPLVPGTLAARCPPP